MTGTPQISRVIALICALLASMRNVEAQDKEVARPSLEGTWIVESVQIAGDSIDGLRGAELVMSDGKKLFKLPSGVVENGTYSIDASKTPPEIDSTTEGKSGKQLGIFSVEGSTLKMCLATQGERPTELVSKKNTDHLLIVFKRRSAARSRSKVAAPAPPGKPLGKTVKGELSRRFRMGFTGFVHDITPEAVSASRQFVRTNGDILAHHIEGVPWAESLADMPFPKALLDDWAGKKLSMPENGRVYLAISPGRGELKTHDKAGPLPAELEGKTYDDPRVKQAYLNYCRRAIEYFQPDYVGIGIEVNEIYRDHGPEKWEAYVALHKHVYEELKKEHTGLPIFASWTLHAMFQHRGGMLDEFKKLMSHNDFVATSYYPFFVREDDRLAALDWMVSEFDEFDKPFAMVETNDTAERLPLPQLKVTLDGTPEKQEAYYRKLLELAHERNFEFVISFVHQDYDSLWEKIKDNSPELFKAWRDCGLLDENGQPRPAYRVWQEYFEVPLSTTSK